MKCEYSLRFLDRYETKVKDYNFGSLIRTDATKEYTETNTIFGWFQSLRVCTLTLQLSHSDANTVLRHRGGSNPVLMINWSHDTP